MHHQRGDYHHSAGSTLGDATSSVKYVKYIRQLGYILLSMVVFTLTVY